MKVDCDWNGKQRFVANVNGFKVHMDHRVVTEAVHLSQSRYCAVSSMVSRGATINYDVSLNGKPISQGNADFRISSAQGENQGRAL